MKTTRFEIAITCELPRENAVNGAVNTGDAGWAGRATAKPCKSFVLLAMLVWLGMWGEEAFAAACTSVATGNWNARATWGAAAVGCVGAPGGIPGAADTAIIANTHTVTVNVNTTVGAVTVNTGGTLVVPGANFTVNGATNVSGTLSHTNTAGTETYIGLVTINAGGVWGNAIGEAITFRGGLTHNGATFTGGTGTQTFSTNNQVIGGASPINFGGVVAVANGVRVTNNNTNVVTIAGNLTGANAASTWVNGANSTLNYSGAAAPMGTRVFTASAIPNTVNYTGAAQTVKLPTGSAYHHLRLSGSGAKTIPAGTITIAGDFTLGAGVTYNGTTNNPAVNLAGIFSNSGMFNSGTGTVTMNGSANQNITGTSATIFNNLIINNGSGVTLSGATNTTVNTLLTLTSGVITTGTNTLIASTTVACSASVSRPVNGGHVAGNLQKRIPTGTPVSCTFEIGDATTYRPISLTFASVTTAGNVTGWSSQPPGDHPDTTNLTSGIDPTLSVNRYWTLTNSGVVFTTCNATFNYVAGDLDGSAAPASFVVAKGSTCSGSGALRTCTSWAQLAPFGSPSNIQIAVNSLTSFAGDDFAVGQAKSSDFAREPQFIYTRERY